MGAVDLTVSAVRVVDVGNSANAEAVNGADADAACVVDV